MGMALTRRETWDRSDLLRERPAPKRPARRFNGRARARTRTALCVCSGYPYPPFTGGRRRTLRLLDAVERAGLRPYLLCLQEIPPEHLRAAAERGWPVEVIAPRPHTPGARLEQHLRFLPRMPSGELWHRIRALSETAAFVLYDELGMAQYVGAERPDVPTVLSLHNVDSRIASGLARQEPLLGVAWLRRWYHWARIYRTERRGARRADALLCVSAADARYFEAMAKRSVVVPNGVDDELFALGPPPEDEERVLFFGSFGWAPNVIGIVRFLRKAWPGVVRRRPAARLRIAGSGPLDPIRAAAGDDPRVDILGLVDDLTAELAGANVVVVPIWQGSGTRFKVLEAMAAGRPAVGTRLGVEGVGFKSERHGLVADAPEAMSEAVASLLADPGLARELGERGRVHAERYRWRTVTQAAEGLYAELARASRT
jgi:polysaccharide biosynthesis protein PslH